MSEPIYLNFNATTPVHPEVVEAMLPYFGKVFGNPSSAHPYGFRLRAAVDNGRAQVTTIVPGIQTSRKLGMIVPSSFSGSGSGTGYSRSPAYETEPPMATASRSKPTIPMRRPIFLGSR
jgi:hypothetical protein